MRCKHPRPTLYEEITMEFVWGFKNGEIVTDESREGLPTGAIFVHCKDCGYGHHFKVDHAMPAWVRKLTETISKRNES